MKEELGVQIKEQQRLWNQTCSHKKTLTSFSVQLHPMVCCVGFHKCPLPGQSRVEQTVTQNKTSIPYYNNNIKYYLTTISKIINITHLFCHQIWYMVPYKYTLLDQDVLHKLLLKSTKSLVTNTLTEEPSKTTTPVNFLCIKYSVNSRLNLFSVGCLKCKLQNT